MYNYIVLDHFASLRNAGVSSQADGSGCSGNSVDGNGFTYTKVHNDVGLKDKKQIIRVCV